MSSIVIGTNSKLLLYKPSENDIIKQFEYETQSNITGIELKATLEWFIFSTEYGTIKIIDNRLSHAENILNKNSNNGINAISLGPSQVNIAYCAKGGELSLYDLTASNNIYKYINNNKKDFICVQISPDYKFIVAGDIAGYLTFINIEKEPYDVKIYKIHNNPILQIKISPNSQYIGTCSADKTIKILSRYSLDFEYEEISTLYSHTGWVWDLEFLSNDSHLISCSSDGTIKLWNFMNGNVVKSFTQHKNLKDKPNDCITELSLKENYST